MLALLLAATLSTGVEIPEEGLSMAQAAGGWHQYTTRMEKRPDAAAITNETLYLKWKWRMNLANPATGLDNDGLRAGVTEIWKTCGWRDEKSDWYDVAARCFDFLVDNVQIGFSQYDYFPAISAWDRHARPMSAILWQHAGEVDAKYSPDLAKRCSQVKAEYVGTVGKDFDHSAPDWDDIIRIGFTGMKARVDSYSADTPFYRAEKHTAAAIMRFLDRLIAEAEKTAPARTVESLKRLREGPPKTCFDLMQFTMVYFILSEPLNYFQVRTLGNIDRIWYPYYQRDLAAGNYSETQFREDFRHFLWQFGSIDNYWGHPIYLGGVNLDGRAAYNPLSAIILDVVERTALPTPKFQLKMGPDTPDEIWWKALDMLRKHCPLCLMSEPNMMRSMRTVGLPENDCRDLLIWGCFEWLPRGRGVCTSASRVILPQPIVAIFSQISANPSLADELPTFDSFKKEYFRRLSENTDRIRALVDESERHLAEINPSLVLSLAVSSALEHGVDAFSQGYDYNYTTISEVGFATAVDSLLAVKEFVYDRKEVSLQDLAKALTVNWNGFEELRLRMKRSTLKWGCGNPVADTLAKEVLSHHTANIVGRPNVRGGKYVSYGLQSRAFIENAGLPATPDGRRKGDHLSKNMAPSVGAEIEGVSASISSYNASCPPENFPCGVIFDIMIHPSIVGGASEKWTFSEPGKKLRVFRALCEQFFAGGGIALNQTIVSAEELRDAQKHPERYENLQVRVAGWNVRWNDIPRKEQDEYIDRIETVGGAL